MTKKKIYKIRTDNMYNRCCGIKNLIYVVSSRVFKNTFLPSFILCKYNFIRGHFNILGYSVRVINIPIIYLFISIYSIYDE